MIIFLPMGTAAGATEMWAYRWKERASKREVFIR